VSLVVLSLALAGSTGPASAAIQTTNLSLTGFSHMAVDDARHHVFVTGAQADGVVVVMNEDGTSAGSIPGIGGASGMVLTGGTLYVARCGAGSITEVDPATLAAVGSFAADVTGTCDLVAAGGRLWYPSSAGLASVSLDSSHTVVTPGTALPDGMLASSSGQPDQLVEGDADHAGPTVRVYDVTDPTGPTLLGSQAFGGGQVVDMAVTPDGGTLLLAQHSSPFKATVRTLPTLGAPSGVTQYGLNRPANAIAVSPNGAKIATGTDDGIADDDVLVFNPGATVSKRFWDFGGTTNVLYPRGLAFSSSGASLFAVSGDVSGAHTVKFHSLSTLPAGSLTIATTKATVLYGHAVTVTAHLGTASSNKRVSIYRKPTTGGAARLVVQGRVNAKGNLKVKVKPAANTIYTATWDGDRQGPACPSPCRHAREDEGRLSHLGRVSPLSLREVVHRRLAYRMPDVRGISRTVASRLHVPPCLAGLPRRPLESGREGTGRHERQGQARRQDLLHEQGCCRRPPADPVLAGRPLRPPRKHLRLGVLPRDLRSGAERVEPLGRPAERRHHGRHGLDVLRQIGPADASERREPPALGDGRHLDDGSADRTTTPPLAVCDQPCRPGDQRVGLIALAPGAQHLAQIRDHLGGRREPEQRQERLGGRWLLTAIGHPVAAARRVVPARVSTIPAI
jgi:hypothetical protein